MRKFGFAACALVAAVGVVLRAAEPAPESYVKAMKTIGAALQAATKANASNDFMTIAKAAADMKPAMELVREYWDLQKTAKPLEWAKESVKLAGDLETA